MQGADVIPTSVGMAIVPGVLLHALVLGQNSGSVWCFDWGMRFMVTELSSVFPIERRKDLAEAQSFFQPRSSVDLPFR